MPHDYHRGREMFVFQPLAVLDQPAPVQNQWYPILPLTPDVRVYAIAIGIEDTGETLECRITRDLQVTTPVGAAIGANNTLQVYLLLDAVAGIEESIAIANATYGVFRSFLVEGRIVMVEARKTTAAGVGNLRGIASWGQLGG